MSIHNFSVFPAVADALFSDRFNRIDRLFSQLTGDTPMAVTPAYDIRRVDNDRYALTVSVPGWKESELEIEISGGQLVISGKREEKSDATDEASGWIHRGISRSDFRLSYAVPEHVKVTAAKLAEGILSVELYQEVPDSDKPRKIPIEHVTQAIEHQS
ncbi:molecular chaperone IbpA [Erwinia toletana]|uniref:Molecular chaperone IbpA n=1 Tax=Winslowiella toletana TaxID=92490 RepID=A0ABS4PFD6_9GAMM|nr:Hsp20 family protein [Winslowiella toletana]MBP2170857.1 molecular chaperone IbpA [Winslowiella toletana]